MKRLLPSWLAELLSERRGLRLTLLLAFALLLPGLLTGWVLDDRMHQLMMSEAPPLWLQRGPHQLYSFMLRDPAWQRSVREIGAIPWFADPDMHATLWRPLASLLRQLDHLLAPESAALAHLHGILWYLALVAAVGAVYRRLLREPWVAGLATLLFAIDDSHGFGVTWVANRYATVSLFFAALSLWFQLRWRQDGDRRAAWLAPACLALGLLAGEMALCMVAYLAAFALLLDRGSWRARLASLAPSAAVVLLWRVAYSLQGFGVGHSAMYVDPLSDPLRFVTTAAERLPLLLQGELFVVPPELFGFFATKALPLWSAAAAALVALLLLVCWRQRKGDRTMLFLAAGMILAALPVCATTPHERLLLPLGLGGSGLVAWLVDEATTRRAGAARSARALAGAWLVLHLWLAALLLPVKTYSVRLFGAIFEAPALSLDQVGSLPGRTLVFVNGPSFFYTCWTPVLRLTLGLEVPASIRVLGTTEDEVVVTTVDERTLRLRPAHGYVNNVLDELLRNPDRPVHIGFGQRYDDLTVEVTEVTADGRPAEVICRFARPLADPEHILVVWTRARGYQPFAPAPVGGSVRTEAVTKIDMAWYAFDRM